METNKPPKRRDVILIALKIAPLLFLALLLVSLLPFSSLTMLSVFVTGWISAAQRFFGAMTFSRGGVAWAIVMIVATLAGAHWFIRTTGRTLN